MRIGDPSKSPNTKGRIPKGSRTPINFFFVIIVKAYAPCILDSASITFSTTLSASLRDTRCKIASVSEVVWKMAPDFTRSFFNFFAFVKFPL